MNPTAFQSSIDCPFCGNTSHWPGFLLPRSFKPLSHEKRAYKPFSGLSRAHRPLTLLSRENWAIGFSGSFLGQPCATKKLFLGQSTFHGKSRTLVLAIIRRNQTRILFLLDLVWAFLGGLIAMHQAEGELDVAYTVIRPHSALGCTFTLPSDYLRDFYSFIL